MDRLKMHSANKVDENVKKIAELFPNTLTEVIKGHREDGTPIIEHAIDFDVLRQELSDIVVEGLEERYQFTWPDKKMSILLANAPIAKTLRPRREESLDFDKTENLYIEGDNLDALKLLQETYLGKVKMIYIDPPYNTGNDFVYEDNFAQSTDEYLANSGQFDEDGNRLVQNTESNGRFHTDWLNMMYPRLKLAKDLLSDDGIIFISIDDNEVENLKKICNEIFGESNFIGTYVKQSKVGGGSDTKFIVKEHEYCIVYSKLAALAPEMFIEHDKDYLKRYKEDDDKGKYFWDTLARPGLKNPIIYEIEAPDGTVLRNGWIISKERFLKEYKEGAVRIIKKESGEWSVQFKQYLNENGKKPRSMTMDFGGSIDGKKDIESIFGNAKVFSYPKSIKYIKTLINTLCKNQKNSIILDFFSGSSTTAHAVMQLNAEDGGNRKFIMVQLPEPCSENSEAYKAGYKTISEIGKERIRRAGKKILEEHPESAGKLDTGFRVLKVDSTNMQDVYYTPDEYTQGQLSLLADNIKSDRTPDDLLFQVMLDLGVLLSSKIEEIVIGGKKVFNVADGYLIACFDNEVTDEVVKEISKKQPYYAVFRDSGIANDSVATNFEQIFETYSPSTIRKVL